LSEKRDKNQVDVAEVIKHPYITEKTFNMIERENKLTFIVNDYSKKNDIKEAMKTLYETEAEEIHVSRGLHGKKAIIKFKKPEAARDLATRLGLV
jgi:large subunit ribosomal protein L23